MELVLLLGFYLLFSMKWIFFWNKKQPLRKKIFQHRQRLFFKLDCFAAFFCNKVESITRETQVDQNVYNGRQKLAADSRMFMSMNEIEICIKAIKIKNCEGYDRIPQRVLVDGIEHLLTPLCKLFASICNTSSKRAWAYVVWNTWLLLVFSIKLQL